MSSSLSQYLLIIIGGILLPLLWMHILGVDLMKKKIAVICLCILQCILMWALVVIIVSGYRT
jgi:hypothetical protein